MNSFSINKVTLLGRLGRDPEQSSDRAPVKISVATTRSWKDKDGEWQDQTTWHSDIDVWGKTGEYVMNNLHQGDVIYLEGELSKDSYEDKEGNKRVKYFIKANSINLVERNTRGSETEESERPAVAKKTAPKKTNARQASLEEEDDVPF